MAGLHSLTQRSTSSCLLGVGRVWLRFSVRVGFSDTEVDILLFVLGLVWFVGLVWFGLVSWVGLGGIGEEG